MFIGIEMVMSMKEVGKMTEDKVMVQWVIITGHPTSAIGSKASSKVGASFYSLMAIITKASGNLEKCTGMVCSIKLMDPGNRVYGSMENFCSLQIDQVICSILSINK